MPDIDRDQFARDVKAALQSLGEAEGREGPLPLREAQARFAGLTAGTLSRIANGIEVSAPVYLAVCYWLGLAPFAYLDLAAASPHSTFGYRHAKKKRIAEQRVAVAATRETSVLKHLQVDLPAPARDSKRGKRACQTTG